MNIKAKLSKMIQGLAPGLLISATIFKYSNDPIILKYVSLNATICHSCSVASISAAVFWTEVFQDPCVHSVKASLKSHYKMHSDFQVLFRKMKSRYKMQRMPSYYKNSAGIRFCCMNSPGNRDGIQHVFTLLVVEMVRALSGTIAKQQVTTCYLLDSCMLWHGLEPVAAHLQNVLPHPAYFFP